MSKEEIKYEIAKVLDMYSDEALKELLVYLKELDNKRAFDDSLSTELEKIMHVDRELLTKLPQ